MKTDFPKDKTGGTARGQEGDRIGSREPSTSAELFSHENQTGAGRFQRRK